MPSIPQLLGTTGQRDKNGVVSIVTRYLCPDLDTAKGLMQTGGNFARGVFTGNLSQDETGAFVVSISTDELPTASTTPQAQGGIAELDFSLTQEKMNTHPNFFPAGGLKESFGWIDDGSGGGSFPATMPVTSKTNGTKKNSGSSLPPSLTTSIT